jgi:2-keto-4-pentenoate hydratase/2-oxohepta-3-ene-1,7-dioic acid hydratase in catechol pathway
MIFCRYEFAGETGFGIVEGVNVLGIKGTPFESYTHNGKSHPLSEVKLLHPVVPSTFYAIGSNYKSHIIERSKVKGVPPKFYDRPRVGYRANSALIGTAEQIIKPHDSGTEFQYEGELVAVIGKKGRNLTPEQAMECILGWTIGNDISERTWQKNDPTNLRGKNADTFKPMGPWIVTDLDYKKMRTHVHLNGKKLHDFDTGNMLFTPGEVIAEISRYNTLSPGDVVWLGTDELPVNLVPGDLIEIEIDGIGKLSNKVVLEGNKS